VSRQGALSGDWREAAGGGRKPAKRDEVIWDITTGMRAAGFRHVGCGAVGNAGHGSFVLTRSTRALSHFPLSQSSFPSPIRCDRSAMLSSALRDRLRAWCRTTRAHGHQRLDDAPFPRPLRILLREVISPLDTCSGVGSATDRCARRARISSAPPPRRCTNT